jgi:hypothetical protein
MPDDTEYGQRECMHQLTLEQRVRWLETRVRSLEKKARGPLETRPDHSDLSRGVTVRDKEGR